MKKYDLQKLWDEHTKYEFAAPDVEATLPPCWTTPTLTTFPR
jgi:hypothetical protein